VVREYVGSGRKGEIAAAEDAARRAGRVVDRETDLAEQATRNAADAVLAALDATVDGLVRAALNEAGYHRHDRGAWRRRRDG
jgi:hypothetical protein